MTSSGLAGAYRAISRRTWPDIAPTASGQKKSRSFERRLITRGDLVACLIALVARRRPETA